MICIKETLFFDTSGVVSNSNNRIFQRNTGENSPRLWFKVKMSVFEDETHKYRPSSRMNVLGPAENLVCATADCHK